MSRLSRIACSTRSAARNVRSSDGAGAGVLQRRADEGAALARLDVLELDDGEQPVVELEGHPVLEVVGGDRRHDRSLGVVVSDRQPSVRTTRESSTRTPPSGPRYTPGSTVTTAPGTRVSVEVALTQGASWMRRPTPWPVPWVKRSPQPAAVMNDRQAASTSLAAHAVAHGGHAARLSLGDEREQLGLLGRRLPQHRRAGHVGVVAVDGGAEVEHQRDRPRGCDGRSGRWWGRPAFGPPATIVSKLGPPAPRRRISLSRARAKSASVGSSSSSTSTLARASPAMSAARWSGPARRRPSRTRRSSTRPTVGTSSLPAKSSGVALLVGPGHVGRLEPDAGARVPAPPPARSRWACCDRPTATRAPTPAPASSCGGLVLVAPVGHEHGRLPRLQHEPRRAAGEAGEVADVHEVAHQQGVAAGLAEAVGDPADPPGDVHGRQAA